MYPKRGRGLGVINLKKHNEALMLNSKHKFFNKLNISWTNLITPEQTITVGQNPLLLSDLDLAMGNRH
jgi:hypothetical protein